MQNIMKTIYECIMILLVMLTIITLWTEESYNSIINWIVWVIFVADFFTRLSFAEDKWNFIKQNPFLVIAIIPFDQFFQMARIVRVIYLFRIKTITKYYVSPFINKFTYKTILIMLSIVLCLLLVEAVIIRNLENSIETYLDALYVTFGHLLFFGHQLFVIDNTIAIWFLTITSVTGIIFQGLALQWIFGKLESIFPNIKKKEDL